MKSIFHNLRSGRAPPPPETLTPSSSSSSHKHRPPRIPKENVDPNLNPNSNPPDSSPFRSPSAAASGKSLAGARARSPLPPRPPLGCGGGGGVGNPVKRKLVSSETLAENVSAASSALNSGVQVVVRIRPPNNEEEEGDVIVQKVSDNSVLILDHMFTFDSVADITSSQDDIFHLVGLPLVENCLAGFNSSIFAYGQTGSGKTYTMWGPPSALLEDGSSSNEKGLTPRVFERLFTRIEEIYNEQITDLLDPAQRNLQIREDARTGVYVDSLTEEYVFTMKDVTLLLIKGLANRRTGATTVNSESSRSHCVFTCVIKCQSKNVEDGVNSSRISRINLVDLAGSERQKLTNAAGERLKEAGNINRSLSQLGNLINILAEVSQSGKQRHIPYRDSRLTFLLQESLGGNAKLAMICAISPSQRCKSETLSTLRFAQRAKAIKNKAVVNEITQDDVNVLREQIRQLKDELVRMKSNVAAPGNTGNYSNNWNATRSLNLLRMSLCRPTVLSTIKDDSDEEMEIDENDVEKPPKEAGMQLSPAEVEVSTHLNSSMEVKACSTEKKADIGDARSSEVENNNEHNPVLPDNNIPGKRKSLQREDYKDSTDCSRKSPKTSSSMSASQKTILQNLKSDFTETSRSDPSNVSSILRSRSSLAPTEQLEATIHHGLQIIENNQNNAILRKKSFRFSVNPVDLKPATPVNKADVGVQTISRESVAEDLSVLKCSSKKEACPGKSNGSGLNIDLQLAPVDGSVPSERVKKQVPKAVEKVLAGAIRREMALEDHCAKQAAEIAQLNRLVQQYKHERECNAIIAQTREDKISRLESLMDGILPTEDFMDEEFISLTNEHKLLKEKYENHPEVLRVNIELKGAQDELDRYRNFFDMGERDVLMEEIQDLRNQLQYYMRASSFSTRKHSPLYDLAHISNAAPVPLHIQSESNQESADEKLREERSCWTEAETKWIALTEELKHQLEMNHSLAERWKLELELERKCTEELKEALQTAMQGHARILEQYAELQEKHITLLARQRRISDGIEDVKRAAVKAGVKGAESKFINSLAAEISVLREEREKDRKYWRDENKGLQAQLRDTAEAMQAAGELLVRLKEAEEASALAQKRALMAEQETEKAYQEIDNLKKNYDQEIISLNQYLEKFRSTKDHKPANLNTPEEAKYSGGLTSNDHRWRGKEFDEPFRHEMDDEFSKATDPVTWFSGYDRCNI
ncbi:Kinesin-like protein KIN12B [Ananas comosus]|uniref:Kinesin-like protein KIN12B n=1 Tax=Ananas comosus TaxID=4615 RepID=A0A199UWH3_ANACO|nr:Kinesin-like protein KIN12B [Ananas comosus]